MLHPLRSLLLVLAAALLFGCATPMPTERVPSTPRVGADWQPPSIAVIGVAGKPNASIPDGLFQYSSPQLSGTANQPKFERLAIVVRSGLDGSRWFRVIQPADLSDLNPADYTVLVEFGDMLAPSEDKLGLTQSMLYKAGEEPLIARCELVYSLLRGDEEVAAAREAVYELGRKKGQTTNPRYEQLLEIGSLFDRSERPILADAAQASVALLVADVIETVRADRAPAVPGRN